MNASIETQATTPAPVGWSAPMPSLLTIVQSIVANRALVTKLIGREIAARYRTSLLGTVWIVVTPLCMLAVFTLVFTTVFPSKWGQAGLPGSFPLVLFSGLIVYQFLADVLGRAPSLLLEDTTLIRKVIFPIEVLPVVAVLSAGVNALISLALLLAFHGVLVGWPPLSLLLVPLLLLPLGVMALGLAYLLAAVGVFLRDLRHAMPLVIQGLLFLGPVFYPLSQLPAWIRPAIMLNPLSIPIEAVRAAIFGHGTIDPVALWVHGLVALALLALGMATFRRLRPAFADVV